MLIKMQKDMNSKKCFVKANLKNILIGAFIVITFVLFIIFKSEVKIFAQNLFKHYGFLGLAGFVIIMDTFIQPISPDLIIAGSTLGGANLVFAALIGGVSSLIAGVIGYNIGKRLIGKRKKSSYSSNNLLKGKILFRKYGIWAVAIGALSPVPYSAICWSAGAYGMLFRKFLITSFCTRIPRFFIVAIFGSLFS